MYEKILKKAYLYFTASTKSVSWKNYDIVSFLVNGLAELCSVKPDVSYTICFGILRSFSTKIKKMQTEGDKQKMMKLYNFKVLNTFRFMA